MEVHDRHISCFRVHVHHNGDEHSSTEVTSCERKAIIKGLRPSTKYDLTMVTVYQDGIETESKQSYFNGSKLLSY